MRIPQEMICVLQDSSEACSLDSCQTSGGNTTIHCNPHGRKLQAGNVSTHQAGPCTQCTHTHLSPYRSGWTWGAVFFKLGQQPGRHWFDSALVATGNSLRACLWSRAQCWDVVLMLIWWNLFLLWWIVFIHHQNNNNKETNCNKNDLRLPTVQLDLSFFSFQLHQQPSLSDPDRYVCVCV